MPTIPSTILGHEAQRLQLFEDIRSGNVSHAYLLAGPPSIGKSAVANWFAFELLAHGLPESERAEVKGKMERLIHPDFLSLDALWMEEQMEDWDVISQSSNVSQQHRVKSKAKTDVISIEDVRALSERLHETTSSAYLCCFIRGMERLQPAAANALLKILEEPPSRVVFVLTTDAFSQLLPTIVSRMRVIHFHPVSDQVLAPLTSSLAEDDRILALHLAQGAPGRLKRLIQNADVLREEKQLHANAKRFWQGANSLERYQWLSGFAKSGASDQFLLHLGLALRGMRDTTEKPRLHRAYMQLVSGLSTNAHRGLLLERFALAVDY